MSKRRGGVMVKPTTPERYFGSVEIKDTCSVQECDKPAVAVMPIRTPEDGPGVWWLCHEHAVAMPAPGEHVGKGATSQPEEIVRTCGRGDQTPCGAAATHVMIVGVRDERGNRTLNIVSVCDRHLERAGRR